VICVTLSSWHCIFQDGSYFHYRRVVPEEKHIRLVHPGTHWPIYPWAHVARHVMLNLFPYLSNPWMCHSTYWLQEWLDQECFRNMGARSRCGIWQWWTWTTGIPRLRFMFCSNSVERFVSELMCSVFIANFVNKHCVRTVRNIGIFIYFRGFFQQVPYNKRYTKVQKKKKKLKTFLWLYTGMNAWH